jgi:3-methyladenine DNA glycosylase AlkD
MTLDEVLQALEAAGTEQNRKVYRRHGVGENQFGVSYAALEALRKRTKVDHALARGLWATGNHDARILATKVADPRQCDGALLDAWAADLDNYVLADAFSALAAVAPPAREKAADWIASEDEWIASAGWNLVASLAMQDRTMPDEPFEAHLATIERTIHGRKNRVRHAMNGVLIAIGLRNDALETKALAAAGRIGKVDVDHGQTGCKTPDVAEYIAKSRDRVRRRAAKAARPKGSTRRSGSRTDRG